MRLDRFLCELNIGTRSQVKAFIRQGIVAVGGVPAKTIRPRFDDRTAARLLELQWWNWPVEKIRANLPRIMQGEIDKLG